MLSCLLFGFGVEFIAVAGAMVGFIFREGKVNLSGRYSVYGKPAYAIGGILIAHAPLTLAVLFLLDQMNFEFVRPGNGDLKPWAVLELALVSLLACLLPCVVIGLAFAERDDDWWTRIPRGRPKRRRGPRRRWDEIRDEEEEREARRRRRRG